MPIGSTPLNDNRRIPNIAFGTGSAWYRRDVTDAVFTALEVGFRHIDTAQAYGNEKNVGIAIKDWLFDGIETSAVPVDVKPRVDNSEHKRKEIWVTTKYGGGERGPLEELKLSLERLHLDYVDLYLIHQPRYIDGNVKGVWREFEWAKELGLAKSIGASNFDADQLQEILKIAKVKPAVNQIRLHAYNYQSNLATLQFCKEHDIVVEAYGSLYPITQNPSGPVTAALIAPVTRLGATAGQILFLWVRTKGAVIVTTSSKEERMREYLGIGQLGDLTEDEVNAIDYAGSSTQSSASAPKSQDGYSESDLKRGTKWPTIFRWSAILCLFTLLTLLLVPVGLFVYCTLPTIISVWPGSGIWIFFAGLAGITGYLIMRMIQVYRTRMVRNEPDHVGHKL